MENLKGKRALVVDDEDSLRDLLVVHLTEHEVETFEASCANDAKIIIDDNDFDFIISDVRMPNGDGVDLLKFVKGMDEKDRPKIVMMTGFSDMTEDEAMDLGALKLFAKPFRYRELMDYLNAQLLEIESENDSSNSLEEEPGKLG